VPAQPGGDREHGGGDRADLPRHLAPAVDPGGPQLQRLGQRRDPAFAHARRAHRGVSGEAVDLVEVETRVRHRGQARVDGQRDRVDHEPAPHARLADAGQRDPVLVLPGRSHGTQCGADVTGLGQRARSVGFGVRFEQREIDVFLLLEAHPDAHPDVHLVRLAADDVRRQARAVVLGERDHGHDIGRRERGQPRLVVDAEADDHRLPRRRRERHRAAAAAGAHRPGRVEVPPAVVAVGDPEHAVGARSPEPGARERRLGEGARGHGESVREIIRVLNTRHGVVVVGR
jgi:hypothetical protein